MVDPEVRAAVDALLDAVRSDPTELPVEEILALRRTGHDVSLRRRGDETVAFVAPRTAGDPRLEQLTPREREVAVLIAAGYSNQQIASTLVLSLATVKDHVHAILRKSGLDSRTQLVAAWYGGLDDELVDD